MAWGRRLLPTPGLDRQKFAPARHQLRPTPSDGLRTPPDRLAAEPALDGVEVEAHPPAPGDRRRHPLRARHRGLLGALADGVSLLESLTNVFLRANGCSLATSLGASTGTIGDSGPGSFSGPFVVAGQAVTVLAALIAAFLTITALRLHRRDVA